MANANTTRWNTVNATVRRQRQPMDNLGAVPSVVFDPDFMMVSHVVLHGSLGSAQHLTPKEATQRKLIQTTAYGNQTIIFIKSHAAQVVLIPSGNLLRQLQPSPSKGQH